MDAVRGGKWVMLEREGGLSERAGETGGRDSSNQANGVSLGSNRDSCSGKGEKAEHQAPRMERRQVPGARGDPLLTALLNGTAQGYVVGEEDEGESYRAEGLMLSENGRDVTRSDFHSRSSLWLLGSEYTESKVETE